MESFSLHALEFDKITAYLHRYAITDLGHERIEALHPSDDPSAIASILQKTVEMADLLQYDDAFPIHTLRDIRTDIEKIRAIGTFLPPDRLLLVVNTLQTSRRIAAYIHQRKGKYPELISLTSGLHRFDSIEDEIGKAVSDEGNIKDSASPKLRQVRRELDAKGSQVRKKLESLARQYVDQGYAAESIVTIREGRMVIPVKDEHKNTVRGFIHDESASGQTVFIEPAEVLELNNAVRKLQLEENREIERILIAIADGIRSSANEITADLHILGEVELLYVKGRMAETMRGIRAHANVDGSVHLINARHPLLSIKSRAAESKDVVPLSLQLGKNGRTLIISGPNAGGKTVALKTVGLLCLMNQTGLLIPCDQGSSLPVFKKILADIGDLQSIENDLSTFSSHIQTLSQMAEMVDASTLLLVDEIGSGTDPREGSALAIALLKHFNARGALSIVTTHHGELKVFAHDTAGILNGSMEFDQQTLQPTYVFRPGVPGSSYAFEISDRMGLPGGILEEAKRMMGRESLEQEKLVMDLHAKIRDYENLLADIERKKTGYEGLSQVYEERTKALKAREKSQKQQIAEEKRRWFAEQRQVLDSLIKELKESAQLPQTAQKARMLINKIESELSKESSTLQTNDRVLENLDEIKVGQRVYIRTMELEGVITEVFDDHLVGISVGQMSMKIDRKHLAKAATDQQAAVSSAGRVEWDTEDIRDEIDLRGLTADEAISEVNRYLSDAQVLGFRKITLVHGKGDGILRKRIGDYLKKDKRVAGYRLGQWGEGDSGVTIVELN